MRATPLNIICFGGGTGLPSLLSGLKQNPLLNVTAVVNMFDTGGSSGELRDKFGILPPGDVLKCLLALSEDEAVARKILLKRIENKNFSGHTGGNLLLFALEKVYGDYPDAVAALGHVLGAKGKVVPVTLGSAQLVAAYKDGSRRMKEIDVDQGVAEGLEIDALSLEPAVPASADALRAISEADVITIGPGSFYTSILPNFLPEGVRDTIAARKVPVIFIANLLTEGKGMNRSLSEKVTIAERMIGRPVDAIIVNSRIPNREILEKYETEEKYPIEPGDHAAFAPRRVVEADLWTEPTIARHNSANLAAVVAMIATQLHA